MVPKQAFVSMTWVVELTREMVGGVKPQVLNRCCEVSFGWFTLQRDCSAGTQWLHSFPVAAVTDDHKCTVSEQQIIVSEFGRSDPRALRVQCFVKALGERRFQEGLYLVAFLS